MLINANSSNNTHQYVFLKLFSFLKKRINF